MKAVSFLLGVLLVAGTGTLLTVSWLERSKIHDIEQLLIVEKNALRQVWAEKRAQENQIDSLQVEMDNLPDSLQVSKTGIIINNSKRIAKAMQRLQGQESRHKRKMKKLRTDRDDARRRLTRLQMWLGAGAVLLAFAFRFARHRIPDP